MDTFHLTCKFWITLNDWDDNNGPFEYWKFSNKPTTNKLNFYSYVMKYHFNIFNMFGITGPMTKTRLLKDYANLSIHGSPRFNSNEKFIEKAKEFGFNKNNIKKFLSKKGTLIIADTSGFHRRGIILQNRKAVHGSIRFDPFKLQ